MCALEGLRQANLESLGGADARQRFGERKPRLLAKTTIEPRHREDFISERHCDSERPLER